QRGRNDCGGLCNPSGKACAAVRVATRRSATSSTTLNTYPGWLGTAGRRGFAPGKSTCVAQLAGKFPPQRLPQIAHRLVVQWDQGAGRVQLMAGEQLCESHEIVHRLLHFRHFED